MPYPILDCLNIISDLGFDGVELCLESKDIGPQTLDADIARRVRDHIQQLKFATHSVSYHKNYIYDDNLFAETVQAIRLTPDFGASIFVFAGTHALGVKDEWSRMIHRTQELVRVAEDEGVILAQEFEPGFIVGCTADLHRLFHEIPSPNLQANLDLGHVFLCDSDPMAAIASLRGRIVHCHIENMADGLHSHLPPWEGDMDLAEYTAALAAIDFDGPLALDLYGDDYVGNARRAVQYLRAFAPALCNKKEADRRP